MKSFNGIGDLLFATPTFRVLKENNLCDELVVNTNRPELVLDNPFVDKVNESSEGIFLGYDDPIHCKAPTCHHIEKDFEIIMSQSGMAASIGEYARKLKLQPEIYMPLGEKAPGRVGVQVMHKGHWHKKKVWPYFDDLAKFIGFEPIPSFDMIQTLVRYISSCDVVVCAEGGISHIAKAVGTKAVVVYGGFAEPEWNGYADQTNLTHSLWCSPCYNSKPCVCKPERACMREIFMSSVMLKAKMMLSASDCTEKVASGATL